MSVGEAVVAVLGPPLAGVLTVAGVAAQVQAERWLRRRAARKRASR